MITNQFFLLSISSSQHFSCRVVATGTTESPLDTLTLSNDGLYLAASTLDGAVCGWAEEGGGAHAPTPYFLALDTSVQLPWLSIRLGLGSGMCGFTPCEAACVVASSTPPPSQPNQARVA